jgi:hypothetical protein
MDLLDRSHLDRIATEMDVFCAENGFAAWCALFARNAFVVLRVGLRFLCVSSGSVCIGNGCVSFFLPFFIW